MEQGGTATVGKSLRFNGNEDGHAATRPRYQATAKYDRKTLKRRLEIEEWMYYELKRLFDCKDDDETPSSVEVDVDSLLRQHTDAKRKAALQVILKEAKHPIEDFVRTLLEKIRNLEPSKTIATEEQEF